MYFICNFVNHLCRVRPSDRIKMSVSKVTSEQYERLNSDLTEIRRAGLCTWHIHVRTFVATCTVY